MTKEKKKFTPLTSNDICEIYTLLHKEGVVAFPLTKNAYHSVDALVANVTGSIFGLETYPLAEEKVVAYLYFLIKNHPFTDGNKRTSSLVFFVLCEINHLSPQFEEYDVDSLVIFLEQYQGTDHQSIITEVAKVIFRL